MWPGPPGSSPAPTQAGLVRWSLGQSVLRSDSPCHPPDSACDMWGSPCYTGRGWVYTLAEFESPCPRCQSPMVGAARGEAPGYPEASPCFPHTPLCHQQAPPASAPGVWLSLVREPMRGGGQVLESAVLLARELSSAPGEAVEAPRLEGLRTPRKAALCSWQEGQASGSPASSWGYLMSTQVCLTCQPGAECSPCRGSRLHTKVAEAPSRPRSPPAHLLPCVVLSPTCCLVLPPPSGHVKWRLTSLWGDPFWRDTSSGGGDGCPEGCPHSLPCRMLMLRVESTQD